MKFYLRQLLQVLILALLPSCEGESQQPARADLVHAVTDLSHEFTFYADNRFHQQYLKTHKGVTNWCNLWNFNLENANLLILPGCDNRINYVTEDVNLISDFLKDGGGVLIFGSKEATSQNMLLGEFGAAFRDKASTPLKAARRLGVSYVEGENISAISLDDPGQWEVLVSDVADKPVMARRKYGKGTLLVSARQLAGSNPNASDSINKEIWKPILEEIAAGKEVSPDTEFRGSGIENLENKVDHGSFILSYNDYLSPFANLMADIYNRSLPFIENRMGVPLSLGMASHVTLLATGGGGFSSGTVVALAVWWGGFPEKEDSMIEFLTHESVHSWVLPFPEVWNEPIATYVGNLVMMDMGHEAEAVRRISSTIERASKIDPAMTNYDLAGNVSGSGRELESWEKNNIHWGKSYWILEQMRKENPDFLSAYFKIKREYSQKGVIKSYDINNTVAVLSLAMRRDLFAWFNSIGVPAYKDLADIELSF